MERTEELFRTVRIYNPAFKKVDDSPFSTSEFLNIAFKASDRVDDNDELIARIKKLTGRKEFSNDPTDTMSEISNVIQRNMDLLRTDITLLRAKSESIHGTRHQQLHYNFILEYLGKRLSSHVEAYKAALKHHAEHVKQRRQRVSKYSHNAIGSGARGAGAGISALKSADVINSYAMFAGVPSAPQAPPSFHPQHSLSQPPSKSVMNSSSSTAPELRRRVGTLAGGVGTSGGGAHLQTNFGAFNGITTGSWSAQEQQGAQDQRGGREQKVHGVVHRGRDYLARLKSSQKVEAAIAQMGELFTSMASLVSQQSETLMSIEDDVEMGLQNTEEAHRSITDFYNITKGNRSMILKIFALLVFFIVMFLVFT